MFDKQIQPGKAREHAPVLLVTHTPLGRKMGVGGNSGRRVEGEKGRREKKGPRKKEMCVRAGVRERLSCTIDQRYRASFPSNDGRSKNEQNGNVLSCRNLFLICLCRKGLHCVWGGRERTDGRDRRRGSSFSLLPKKTRGGDGSDVFIQIPRHMKQKKRPKTDFGPVSPRARS